MKRTRFSAFICFLVFCIVTVLCGCQKEEKESDKKLPQIRVGGVVYEPYFYKDIDGEFTGIDVELAKEAFHRMGYEPVFVDVDIAKVDSALQEDIVDCLWSCYTMEEREDKYLWAGPYLYTRRVLAVKTDSDIKTIEDLEGKTIAVQANSMTEKIFLENMNPEIPTEYKLHTYRTVADAFTALRKGYVDAVGGHEATLGQYTAEYPEAYQYLNISLYRSRLGVAFAKDKDEQLVQKLTQTLNEMREDGTITEILTGYHLDVESNLYKEEE